MVIKEAHSLTQSPDSNEGIKVIWGGCLVMRQVPIWAIHTILYSSGCVSWEWRSIAWPFSPERLQRERERERESVGVLGSKSEHWSFLQLGWHNRPSFFFGASEDWFFLLTKYLLISLFLCIPMGSIYSFFTSLFFHLWDRDPFSTSSSLYTDLLF